MKIAEIEDRVAFTDAQLARAAQEKDALEAERRLSAAAARWDFGFQSQPVFGSTASSGTRPNFNDSHPTLSGENTSHMPTAHIL